MDGEAVYPEIIHLLATEATDGFVEPGQYPAGN